MKYHQRKARNAYHKKNETFDAKKKNERDQSVRRGKSRHARKATHGLDELGVDEGFATVGVKECACRTKTNKYGIMGRPKYVLFL